MFEKDLKEWKQIEREFASRLMKYDVVWLEFSQWKCPDWDIKATIMKDWKPVERTYEIKRDKKSDNSGNVWIEYMCNGKPSGIYTSKADYIAYKLGDNFYYADRIRFIIELSKLHKADVVWWDWDNSQMFLIPKDVFKLHTTEI